MAYESSIIAYISMFFLSIGIGLLQVLFVHNHALQLEEYAVGMIEHHNRYDSDIAALIQDKAKSCQSCSYEIVSMSGSELRYEVRVVYSVVMMPLRIKLSNTVYALTAGVS